ncbi:MAG: hypothetical protein ABI691_15280 [Ginsengibacter sp.]
MEKKPQNEQPMIDVKIHRRILSFLNAARRPEDLMVPPPNEVLLVDEKVMDADEILHHDEIRDSQNHPGPIRRPKPDDLLLERELAKRVLCARNDYSPLYGFRHISQLEKIPRFNRAILDRLIRIFSAQFKGKWEVLYDAD